jgi:hypothetical protein
MHAAFADFSTDTNGNYHACYNFCAPGHNCANTANWTLVNLMNVSSTLTIMDESQLAVDAEGHPRVMIVTSDNGGSFMDHYYFDAGDGDCTNAANWHGAEVAGITRENFPFIYQSNKHFLTLDPQGRPRFVLDNGVNYEYHSCDLACTSAGNWHFSGMGLVPAASFETSGQEPDLALDSQDHPRLSFQTVDHTLGNGLGYGWCDVSCESGSPTWQKVLADPNSQLNVDWNRVAAGCTGGTWIGGYRSALALDAAGNPRIG